MIAAPERHAVELHAQARGGETRDEQFVVAQLLAGPHGERVLAGEPDRLPLDRRLRRCLHRHQQPLVGLRQPCRHGAVGGRLLRLGLLHLVRRQVERVLLGEDRLPGEVRRTASSRSCSRVLSDGEEDERVAVEARRVAARLEDRLGGGLGGASGSLL